jgi:hypothetical protein
MPLPVDTNKPPLPDYYDAKRLGPDWHLTCRVCKRRWALPVGNDHPGNLLRLLDHGRSHTEAADATT